MEWTYKEASEAFLRFESDWNLFDRSIDDIPFWEHVRVEIQQELLEKLNVIGQAHTEKGVDLKQRLKGIYLWARNLIYKSPFLSGNHEFVFFGHPRRKLGEDGYWWDLYCDSILESLKLDYQYFEYDYQLEHASPAKTANRRYVDFINYTGTICKFAYPYRIAESDAELLDSIATDITNRFDCEINIEGKVRAALTERRATRLLFEKVLKRADPKVAVIVVSYGKEPFIEACKGLGIPVVELQHGSIHEYHMGYSFRGERTKRAFPDYFFSFGPFWRESVDFPIPDERIYDVGYPYLDDQAKQYSKIDSNDSIVFISQGSVGERLSKFAIELSELIEDDREIVYKLHPGEYDRWRNDYPWLVDADVTVVDEERPTLYRLFAEASIQIGVYSTAIYEGLMFGLRTYLVDLPGIEYMEGLLEEDHVQRVKQPADIAVSADEGVTFDTERYFVKDPIANVDRALTDVVRTGTCYRAR